MGRALTASLLRKCGCKALKGTGPVVMPALCHPIPRNACCSSVAGPKKYCRQHRQVGWVLCAAMPQGATRPRPDNHMSWIAPGSARRTKQFCVYMTYSAVNLQSPQESVHAPETCFTNPGVGCIRCLIHADRFLDGALFLINRRLPLSSF